MLLSLDGTLVVQVVNFIVYLLILNAIFLRPVGRAIAARRAYINSVAADIERFEGELKALRVQANDRRAAARRQAEATIAEQRGAAAQRAGELMAELGEEAAAIARQAQATVELEVGQVRQSEDQLVESLARTMLERAVGPELAR